MQKPNITPGSWRQSLVSVRHDIHDVLSQDGATVAFISEHNTSKAADGKVITALPDLLAVVERVASGDDGPLKVQAVAALVKAGYTFD